MLKLVGLTVVLIGVLATAAYTKPSREALHDAARSFADNSSLVGSVATRMTGLFGNDAYDDYIFFDRYRVFVGRAAKVDCFGAFGKTACRTPTTEEPRAS
ncbi:MAG TPA: hypothetical protein VG843_02085 [Rhizomicrobium sp.]|jgi:hypothetical protein|nr:hypothetical protein [Rhizomicrobium sp.]